MKRLILLLLFVCSTSFAQGLSHTNVALYNSGGNARIVPSAVVTVCAAADPQIPCTAKSSIYTNYQLTSALANPFNADANGNYSFYAGAGNYTVTVTGIGITGLSYQITLGVGTPSSLAGPGTITGTFGGNYTTTGNNTHSGTETFTGDLLAKSGRPWFDVMAFGAKNDNTTDDTAAIQAAFTAACLLPTGGTVYFPAGAGYRSANTSAAVITISCNNITIQGAGYSIVDSPSLPPSTIYCPLCTGPILTFNNSSHYGFRSIAMGYRGGCFTFGCAAQPATGTGIAFLNSPNWVLEDNFFDQFGSSAIVSTGGSGAYMKNNFAQACVFANPAATDTGCYDLANADVVAIANFATTSAGTGPGNIGNGHAYAWAIRGTAATYISNFGELSQHGFLITGTANRFIGNRAYANQGNGFRVTTVGTDNLFNDNLALTNSQNANGSFSAWRTDGQGSRNLFVGNNIACSGGNGNLMLNAFDDANTNGTGDANDNTGNFYTDNRMNSTCMLASGVLYNFTGTSPNRVNHPSRSQNQTITTGAVTLTCGANGDTQFFNSVLTGTITVTLATSGAWNGCKFRVVRGLSATGAFNIVVTGQTGFTAAGQQNDYEYINAAWQTVATGILPNNPASIPTVPIPISSVGSAGLSATAPIRIAATGVIDCAGAAQCVTSAAALTNNVMVKGAGLQATQTSLETDDGTTMTYTGTGGYSAPKLVSTVSTGTAPLTVTSTTAVANLKVQNLSAVSGGDLPSAAGGTDVGSTALPYGNLWLGTAATNNFKFQPATTSGARIITMADPLSPTTVALPMTIASGTSAMTTALIATVACGTTVTTAATGVLTTDVIDFDFNAAVTAANNGLLIVKAWPTAGNVNFNYCNPTAAGVTPTAMTVNWSVRRP